MGIGIRGTLALRYQYYNKYRPILADIGKYNQYRYHDLKTDLAVEMQSIKSIQPVELAKETYKQKHVHGGIS